MACNLCKRKTVAATSYEHFNLRMAAFLESENKNYGLTSAEAYHAGMATTLLIIEQTPISFIELFCLSRFCSGITTFTPYAATDDDRYLFNRQLKQEGLTVIDALVRPVQNRVELIRASGDWERLRA